MIKIIEIQQNNQKLHKNSSYVMVYEVRIDGIIRKDNCLLYKGDKGEEQDNNQQLQFVKFE